MSINLLRILILFPFLSSFLQARPVPGAVILQPVQGDSVRGVVQVNGTASGDGFASYDLVYAFENSSAPNYFTISTSSQPVESGLLGSWDTTTITDGDYSLKLQIHFKDGSTKEFTVGNILVRNYTASDGIESNRSTSPALTGSEGTKTVEPDNLSGNAANPASLQQSELMQTMSLGLAIGIGILLAMGVYTWLRHITRR